MRKLVIALVLAAAAVVPAAVQAGGWATVVMAPPPAGLEAEETWAAQLSVMRHGVTPTDGATPSITIRGPGGTKTFTAQPTGETGAYIAKVVFSEPGSWDYEVSDGLAATGYGYSQTHTYSPVEIASPTGGGGGGGVPAWPFAVAAIALVAAGAVVVARQRCRRPAHQS